VSEALRAKLVEIKPDDPDGRTFAEILAENLVSLACAQDRSAVAAAAQIAARVEGRAHQSIEIADVAADLRARSDEELRFYLANGRWPGDGELLAAEEKEPTQ
jgi:hypothetical protein